MHTRLIAALLVIAPVALVVSAGIAGLSAQEEGFDFALFGDLPYGPEQESLYEEMIEDINREQLDFVVHDGDIKSERSPCTDDVYRREFERFNRFTHPVVYTPGDNEWTDCHLSGADPLERLAALRAQFYSGTQSLGGRPLLTGGQAGYPENRRWRAGPVTFTTVHVVGSNDNFGRTPEADAEHTARKVANLAWIAGAFAEAVALGDQAVVLIMQANLRFERSPEERTGFNDYLGLLEERTAAFTGKVFLVHGDTHRHRIDQPMRSSETGERLSNVTRVETFGHPDVEWVRASVDPSSSDLIEFEPGSVRENG